MLSKRSKTFNVSDSDIATLREAKIQEAAENGRLVDDTVILFRKVVDRMPTTTWLLDARNLVNSKPESEREAARIADARQEIEELREDLHALASEWVARWYLKEALFSDFEGGIENFRDYVESLAPELPALDLKSCEITALPETTVEQFRAAIQPCAAEIVMQMMKNAHLVVSDAMKYALLG